ncbi:MAG: alpha-L-rhamnosidase C-terminal domain-containing protein, partial [Mariniphaga sp.]
PLQAAQWTKQAEQIKANIQKWLWSPDKRRFTDSYGVEKCSQQTQVYALLYGLVTDSEKENIVNAIAAENRKSEQSFSYYVVHSVFDSKPQWALDFIRQYWGDQMKSPFFNGAWHEAWDIEHWATDLGTTSHAWCSGPTALLPEKVLGLEPVTAGWQTFSVRPNPCDLKWAKGVVSSPFGPIVVEWKVKKDGVFKLYVVVPENTKAEIALPGSNPAKVKINDLPAVSCSGIKSGGIINGRAVFIASPGEYQIVLTK